MCIAGERGESCLGNGDGRELEKVGGGKNDPSFSFFFEKIVSFLKNRKGRRREWLRRGDKEKSNRKRDDRETGEESYD